VILASRAITDPIQRLVDGTRSIAAGDLNTRIQAKSNDELGILAESFNQMAGRLQTRTQELMGANEKAIENARLYEHARVLATMEERQRLARELHDSVTQSLYSLTLLAEASRRTASSGDTEKVIGNITRLGETAQQALKEMRLLVYELRPLALEQAGLAAALQNRLDAVEKRAGVEAQLRVSLEADLPPHIENGLYRIAQEALNNSLKHAEATKVFVSLKMQEGNVELEIADNGKGFDMEAIQDQGGMGMVSIRERVQALHGEYSITSKPNEGTQVWVRVPLNPSA
jgi:signal transduction histidine kinase